MSAVFDSSIGGGGNGGGGGGNYNIPVRGIIMQQAALIILFNWA